jgi:hypothetical protein
MSERDSILGRGLAVESAGLEDASLDAAKVTILGWAVA